MILPRRIGVDIGKVLCGGDTDDSAGTPTMFGPDFLHTPEVPGGFSALADLVSAGHALHLVSKCGERVQQRTELWLEEHRAYDRIGLDRCAVHFVRKREDKAPVARLLRLDAFVDDRLEVLLTFDAQVRTRVLFGPQPAGQDIPAGVAVALGWSQALVVLTDADSRREYPGTPATLTAPTDGAS